MDELHFTSGPTAISQYREAHARAARLQGDPHRLATRRLQLARRELVLSFTETTLLRVLSETRPGAESLTWFWFNHFNVFWKKDLVGAALPDYVDAAVRPNVRGRFRDLLLATLTHPAMLSYLDNARNVAGKINENLARELLELHTLGVEGGYVQADVREVARVLTGVGLRPKRPPKMRPDLEPRVVERGEFFFDPRRHERGAKRVLGRKLEGAGFDEVEALVDLLAAHPATARHIAGKLCFFLLGDEPPEACVTRAAKVFAETGGHIGKTVDAVQQASETGARKPARSFKDPFRFVTSAVRLLSAGREVTHAKPVARWLAALGQPLFGCRTPDGYSLRGSDWVSAGQLTQRFELAREMVHAMPRLVDQPLSLRDVMAHGDVGALVAALGPASRSALAKAERSKDRLALLLSSPEFMYWQAETCA